jgi:hypothetical protein
MGWKIADLLQWQAKHDFIGKMKSKGGRARALAVATVVVSASRKRAKKKTASSSGQCPPGESAGQLKVG